MKEAITDRSAALTTEEQLALAREALAEYRSRCFWFLSPDFAVTEETLNIIVSGLRRQGDRRAFLIADRLCQ